VEIIEVRDRLEALAREVRLISLGLFGITHLLGNDDDTGPLIDFASQVEDKLLALALEMHPDEGSGLAPEGDKPPPVRLNGWKPSNHELDALEESPSS
jgi:hypothetical protein